VSIFTSK